MFTNVQAAGAYGSDSDMQMYLLVFKNEARLGWVRPYLLSLRVKPRTRGLWKSRPGALQNPVEFSQLPGMINQRNSPQWDYIKHKNSYEVRTQSMKGLTDTGLR